MLKRYERGELAAIDWLDALALARIRQLRVEVKLSHALQLLAAHRQSTGAYALALSVWGWEETQHHALSPSGSHSQTVKVCGAPFHGSIGPHQQHT